MQTSKLYAGIIVLAVALPSWGAEPITAKSTPKQVAQAMSGKWVNTANKNQKREITPKGIAGMVPETCDPMYEPPEFKAVQGGEWLKNLQESNVPKRTVRELQKEIQEGQIYAQLHTYCAEEAETFLQVTADLMVSVNCTSMGCQVTRHARKN